MKSWKLMLCGAALASLVIAIRAQQPSSETVRVDPDDIGGVVTSSKGPEAGCG